VARAVFPAILQAARVLNAGALAIVPGGPEVVLIAVDRVGEQGDHEDNQDGHANQPVLQHTPHGFNCLAARLPLAIEFVVKLSSRECTAALMALAALMIGIVTTEVAQVVWRNGGC
jgi:hypothetical protein